MITQRTRLDMRPGGVLPVVHVSQYDNDAAALIFDLYDDGELFTVPTGSSVLLNGLKPDNYGFSYQAASISGNTVVCNLTTQMTAVAGAVVCELRVRNGAGTQIIGSCNFILQVEAAALTDDTIISDTMIPLIEQAVEIASNLDRYITQTQSNAQIATEAATTATNAANSAQIVDANVTGLYNSIEEAKTNANTAAANANTVAANIAAAAARGDYKGDKGDKGDSGVTTPVWGMYTMYVDESTGDLWLVTNGEYGSEYWFRYDSETGLLYYCTPDYVEKTVSGELIEITDGANLGALQCKVAFSPIQSGTGDPSPTNIRPISGRTGMTVTRAGKNLLPSPVDGTYTGNGITAVVSGGKITLSGTTTASGNAVIIPLSQPVSVPVGSYIHMLNTVSNASVSPSFELSSDVAGTNATASCSPTNRIFANPKTEVVTWDRIRFYLASGVTVNLSLSPMLCMTSDYSEYVPYVAPTTYPITWESIAGTVYGGTLDVVSGVLTVTHGYILLDGTQGIRQNGRTAVTQRAFVYIAGKAFGRTNIQSNRFSTPSTSEDKIGYMVGRDTTNGVEFFLPLEGTAGTDESCKQWFADNNTQFVYPLATPQTYQLTPTEVRTILGVNNLWSDGDTIEAFTYVSESYDEEG